MSIDRRLSLRTCVDLPMSWQPLTEPLSLTQLCSIFALPTFVQLQGQMLKLDTELDHVLHNISDSSINGALRLLDRKLDLICEAQQVNAAIPPNKNVELSADGIGFEANEPLPVGSWMGIHLVLPTAYHLLSNAQVGHCEARVETFWVGTEFSDLEPPTAKKLTRFVVRSKVE